MMLWGTNRHQLEWGIGAAAMVFCFSVLTFLVSKEGFSRTTKGESSKETDPSI